MKTKADFDGHEIWQRAASIEADERLKALPTDTRHYLQYLLEDLKKRRELTNHYYVSSNTLNNLNNQLSYIQSYIENPLNIESYIAESFSILTASFPANNGRQAHDISLQTYELSTKQVKDRLEEILGTAGTIDELKNEIEAFKNTLEQDVEEYETNATAKIDAAIAETNTRTNELNEELETHIAETKSTTATQIKDIADKFEEDFNELERTYTGRLSLTNDKAGELLKKVQKRASSISGWVIADSYGKYARNKTILAIVYDVLAVCLAIVGVFLVAFALTGLHADETSATVYKFAVSVATFTASGFLFKRGTYQHREAKAAKRTELTLRQYESFIAALGEEKQNEITEQIAERIFIRGDIDDSIPTIAEAIANRGMNTEELKVIIDVVKQVLQRDVLAK